MTLKSSVKSNEFFDLKTERKNKQKEKDVISKKYFKLFFEHLMRFFVATSEAVHYRATLHKTFSKLFLGQKEYSKALDELKNGVKL